MTPPTPSTTYYCQVSDVADFLRVTFNRTSLPSDVQVANIINRKEDEIDRRTGHAWRTNQVTEVYDLPLIYTYGWGTPIFLHHRKCKSLDTTQGDSVAIWDGSNMTAVQFTNNQDFNNTGGLNFLKDKGTLYLRGYLFTILRENRVQITYRFGDVTVPGDIKDAVIKMTAIDLMTSSLKMDKLGVGTEFGLEYEKIIDVWRADIERTIWDRTEFTVVTN